MNYLLPPRLDALARAYALGTMSPRASRRFARTLTESAAALQAVVAWREALATLERGAPVSMAPHEQVWIDIQRRLFRPAVSARALPARGLRRRVAGILAGVWWGRWPTALGLAAGALLCIGLVQWRPQMLDLERTQAGPPASYVGVLQDGQGRPALATMARRHGRALTVRLLQPVALAPDQVLTLWAWSAAQPIPLRVGSWPAQQSADLELPASAEALLGTMTHLGVSREVAGPPPAQPTAPLWAQGPCAKVW